MIFKAIKTITYQLKSLKRFIYFSWGIIVGEVETFSVTLFEEAIATCHYEEKIMWLQKKTKKEAHILNENA